MIFYSFVFKNSAPNSVSVANTATNSSIVQRVKIVTLRCMGCLSCGVYPRKKCMADMLRTSLADK